MSGLIGLSRLAGALYLVIMVAALFAEAGVRGSLVMPRDVAASVHNILASESLYRWGIVADAATVACDVAVAALLFLLLRPVGEVGALAALSFRIAYSAAMAVNVACSVAALRLIRTLPPGQSGAAEPVLLFLFQMHGAIFDMALVLFGTHLAILGVLIHRSTFLPKAVGAAIGLAGGCYLINSVATFLSPALAAALFPWMLLPGFVAEGALTLWLLIAGVDAKRWAEREERRLDVMRYGPAWRRHGVRAP